MKRGVLQHGNQYKHGERREEGERTYVGLDLSPLHLSSFVLEPDLHSPRRHAQLVCKLNSSLLAGHLVRLEYLFQDGQLIGAGPLALLLVMLVR